MESEYLKSLWKQIEEEKSHLCLEEVFSKKGFQVRNLHRDDRFHESGIDLLCTKGNVNIGFAVKKKPKKEDLPQLKKLAQSSSANIKFYVYLDNPTTPFESEKAKFSEVHFLDRNQLHSLLIQNGSIHYLLQYFSAHKLFDNLSSIYEAIYESRNVTLYEHPLSSEELTFIWNLKDDAVKLKASLEFMQASWRPILMTRLDYNKTEWTEFIKKLHNELDIINNLAGESLSRSFISMSEKFPHLAAYYWEVVSKRTVWKDFTYTAINLGKRSSIALKEFIRNKWVVPILEHNRRSTEYGPIGSVYSTLWAVIESTYNISNDIEMGLDWLHSDLV